jgi:nitrous oxidase accessory protein NosD
MLKIKAIWPILCLLSVFSLIAGASSTVTIKTYSPSLIRTASTITIPDNYSTIQLAINAANPGDTVFVKKGTYHEHIEINKTITLIGENPANTIIDGDGVQYTPIMRVNQSNVIVENLTIRNTASSVETYGILISGTQNVSLLNMTVRETYRAIVLNNVNSSRISDSQISNNYAYGITLLANSQFNNFTGNNIISNPTGAWLELSSKNDSFFHNNFINNYVQVDTTNYGTYTKWDNGYPLPHPLPSGGGNYWSDYTGSDTKSGPYQDLTGSDGIGDTPYREGGAYDRYPLMKPWKRPIYPIAKFSYSPTEPVINKKITFNASASYDPDGYIVNYAWDFGDGNITTIPNATVKHLYMNSGNYSITLTVTDNSTLTDSTTQTITVAKRTSELSIYATPAKVEIGKSTIINGTLLIEGQPPTSPQNIEINYTQEQANWNILANITTSVSGAYRYNWNTTTIGQYWLIAFWNGNASTYPACTPKIMVNVTKKSSTLTITATPTSAVVGAKITIKGKLTPARQGENITITYGLVLTGGLTWKLLTILQTNTNGNYFYNWTTTTPGSFYVLKAIWPGDDLTDGSQATTGFITISRIPSNITINVDRETVTVGSNITISGNLTPTRSNVTITIQIRKVNGTGFWNFIAQTDANGNYVTVWNTPDTGTFNITAGWRGDNITMPANSKEWTVSVTFTPQASPTSYYVGGVILIIIIAIIVLKLKKGKP